MSFCCTAASGRLCPSKVSHREHSRQPRLCSPKRVTLPPSDQEALAAEVLWLGADPSATLQLRQGPDANPGTTHPRPIAKVPGSRARSPVRRTRRPEPARMMTQLQPGTTLRHLYRQLSAEWVRRTRLHVVSSQPGLSQGTNLRGKLPKGLQPLAPLQLVRRGGPRPEHHGSAFVARGGALHRISQDQQHHTLKPIQLSKSLFVEHLQQQEYAEGSNPGPNDPLRPRNGKAEQVLKYGGGRDSTGTLLPGGFLYELRRWAGTGLGRAPGRSHVLVTPSTPATGRARLVRFPTTSRKFAPAHESLRATRHLPKVCYLSGNYLR